MKVLILNPPSLFTKNVVRDLIYGSWCKGKRIGGANSPPTSLLSIASILKKQNHEITFLDALGEQKTIKDILPFSIKKDVVIISTSTMSFSEDVQILSEIKKPIPPLSPLFSGPTRHLCRKIP
jgi:anaerobic magnesium-protoporphyrin IX monomethyl ester cyclase